MSDFVPSDIIPDLWEEILKRHWKFLDTEEGKQKIEERIKLEGCLKEFLCVVPHDRKFFLPETAYVLKQSIREMEDFTANKGIIGFEAVSQYANNLFTKPWRKEFRVLKMYSGFFQHEINSNLKHAIKLFEAMGYRRLSDETLILDGPICPDQVTNVSRDAMAASVECKIMKYIYAGLSTMGLKCSLRDIFNYREKYTGGTSQAIQELAYALKERRHHKEKLLSDNSYATIQHLTGTLLAPPPPPPPPIVPQCPNCTTYYHNLNQTPNLMHSAQQCSLHSNQMHSSCAVHPTNTKLNTMCNNRSNSKFYAPYPTPHMSHSRSLEHYNEPPPVLPHRHSFDHQQHGCTAHQGHYQVPRAHAQCQQHLYESPYDCIDGGDESLEGSSASYAAVAASNNVQTAATYAHPYNVSGNRYPLPFNISNQLNAHYSTPTVTCNGVKGTDAYSTTPIENLYATVSKPVHRNNWPHQTLQSHMASQPNRLLNTTTNASTECRNYRQRPFPSEQLIDFDDRASLTLHDYNAQQHMQTQHHFNEMYGDQSERMEREFKHNSNQRSGNHMNGLNHTYAEPKDLLCQQHTLVGNTTSSDDAYGNNLYSRPLPRSNRVKDSSVLGTQTKHMTDKHIRKTDNLQVFEDNNRKMPVELSNRNSGKVNGGPKRKVSSHTNEYDGSDLSYDSVPADDFVTVCHSEHAQRSPTQATKNQDGVGSFESWNYVFQNLERSGYSKDLGERGDLLVQSLDLDSLNLNGGGNQVQNVEKRRSVNHGVETKATTTNTNRQSTGEKCKTLEKVTSTEKCESKTTKQEKPSILKPTTIAINGNKRNKSTLKAVTSNNLSVDHSKSNGNSTTEKNIARQNSSSGNTSNVSVNKTKVTTARSKQAPVATQVIISSPNEWSCRFCTFLNPDKERICAMCSHSKDFNLEATVSNTPTCV